MTVSAGCLPWALQHEMLRELYLVVEGSVDLFTARIAKLTTLLAGDYFGDVQVG